MAGGSTARIALFLRAIDMLAARTLSVDWIARGLCDPDHVETDPSFPNRQRAFKALPERDGRVLRVVFEVCGGDFLVVTAFLDRSRRHGRQIR